MSEARSILQNFLLKAGTDSTPHSGRSLVDHLLGTYDMLKSWNCSEEICLAGGLHSIYGTNAFKKESLPSSLRPLVREVFGDEVERLAWVFGCIDRPRAIELGVGVNRRDNTKVVLEVADLNRLRLIEAANLLEQGANLMKWPNILAAKNQVEADSK